MNPKPLGSIATNVTRQSFKMRFKINLLYFLLVTVFLGTAIGLYISNMPGELVVLTADNFKKQVVDNDRPVLVAFTADW